MRSMSLTPALLLLVAVACADPGPAAPLAPTDPTLARATAPTLAAPVFDLAISQRGTLLAGEGFVGVTEIQGNTTRLIGALTGVTGIGPVGKSDVFALTGAASDPSQAATEKRFFRIANGKVREIADLGAYENAVNPDQTWNTDGPDSNPFNLARLSGSGSLVADAAGNDILHVSGEGVIDWVAVLTPQLVSTAHFKELIGCPQSGAPECALPPAIPAQPVATSIAVGPDGAYYAS